MKVGLRSSGQPVRPDVDNTHKYHRLVQVTKPIRAWCTHSIVIDTNSIVEDDTVKPSRLCGRCFSGRSRSDV